jgi:hypothetical protein
MRAFRPVVAPSAAPVLLLDPEFASSGAIRPQVVGDQSIGNEAVFSQQLAHDLQRSMLVTFGLDQRIEDLAFAVDGAPQVDQAAVDSGRPHPNAKSCRTSAGGREPCRASICA